MLNTVFADVQVRKATFKRDFDDHLNQFLAGQTEQLSEEYCVYFEAIFRYLSESAPGFDVRNGALPAIVWLRFAYKIWLHVGGVSSECLDSYVKWRAESSRRNRLILVAPESLVLKIERGDFSNAEIQRMHDCYPLDVFLIAEEVQPKGLLDQWRTVEVPVNSDSETSKGIAPVLASRSFQNTVGAGRYQQAENAIRKAAQDRLLGRMLSMAVDKKTNKYLYEGRREELLEALKANGCEIVAGREVALKLISHFVQCRKGSVVSRKSDHNEKM